MGWAPPHPRPLPASLPTTPEALLALLGAVQVGDRPPLLVALAALPRPDLLRGLRAWRPGLDPALGCGTGLCAAALGGSDLAPIARGLARAAEPELRCCAAEALGAVAQGSLLSALARMLEDPDAPVRAAAARALGQACSRSGDQALGASWLQRVAQDPDERVVRARLQALEKLGA